VAVAEIEQDGGGLTDQDIPVLQNGGANGGQVMSSRSRKAIRVATPPPSLSGLRAIDVFRACLFQR
jgi:hypothetical protein